MATRTWAQEKAYCASRAAVLREQMIEATRANDMEAFAGSYEKAQRYMSRKELHNMMIMFVSHWNN